MSAPVPTPADVAPAAPAVVEPPAPEAPPVAPVVTPPVASPKPAEPPAPAPAPTPAPEADPDMPTWAQREVSQANREAQKLRERATAAETELLKERYGFDDELLEFVGTGTYAERAARAEKLAAKVQPATPQEPAEPNRPPSERPVASLRPGASPTPPPVEDTSYPAAWGFQPPRDT